MSPITSFFTLLVFGCLAVGFRHQFVCIYPIVNDSGGFIWLKFIRLPIVCMVLAEILVLFAVLLLKETFVAALLMVPLLLVSVLFHVYISKRHYMVTRYLPLAKCAVKDAQNEGVTSGWLVGAYFLQPALKDRVLYPDNYTPNENDWTED